MSEPIELDDIYILLDELFEQSNTDLVLELAVELQVSRKVALSYVNQWLHHNGE